MTSMPYQPVIQVILLKTEEYLIAEIEEREEAPECLLINPFKIVQETHWEYGEKYKHYPSENAVLLKTTDEYETDKDGNKVTRKQYDYFVLEKFPQYTNQNQIYLRASDILTLADPSHLVLECYRKTLG